MARGTMVTFVIGVVMLGAGLLIISLVRPRDGKRAAFMKSEFIELVIMLLVIALVLGGTGTLIGSVAELIMGTEV